MKEFDVAFARSQFPAFDSPDSGDWAYFENAGGSIAPGQVTGRLDHFFRKTKVQPYYPYGPSMEGGEAMDRSQQLWAESINAGTDEVQLGPSTTMNVYILAHALRAEMEAGDRIIVSQQDHEANIGAWAKLAETGIDVQFWSVDPEQGLLNVEDLEALLNDRTKLVCVTHCSNVSATINPVADIINKSHAAGARVVIDGVSYAPHGAIDVKDLDVDFYLFSLYKTYGPHIGLMYARRDHLEQIENQGHFFNAKSLDKRLTPAGPDHGEIACASGVIDYYRCISEHHLGDSSGRSARQVTLDAFELFWQQEQALMTPLLEFLGSRPGVRIIGCPEPDRARRVPTIAFTSDRNSNEDIVKKLAESRVGCGYGHFYAWRLMEGLGLDPDEGVTRISLVHYNTAEEVQRAISALEPLL